MIPVTSAIEEQVAKHPGIREDIAKAGLRAGMLQLLASLAGQGMEVREALAADQSQRAASLGLGAITGSVILITLLLELLEAAT